MSKKGEISMAVVKRLPRYYRYLGDLLDKDIARISSHELSARMGITASQIRQDLSNFGCFGQQGYGYNVAVLYQEIESILGLERKYSLILIGAGHLGQTLVNYPNFAKRGFRFIAIFDNSAIVGQRVNGVLVYHVAEMAEFLAENPVDIAVLTVPDSACDLVVPVLTEAGIKGIWNFTARDFRVPKGITVESVRLADSLMTLSYRINEDEIKKRVER